MIGATRSYTEGRTAYEEGRVDWDRRSLILAALEYGPMTSAQIEALTGLPRRAVPEVARTLIQEGHVIHSETMEPTGRKVWIYCRPPGPAPCPGECGMIMTKYERNYYCERCRDYCIRHGQPLWPTLEDCGILPEEVD